MGKKIQNPKPVEVGDAFAVPLENGRFSVCRVLRIGETGMIFVVSSAWTGEQVPDAGNPALRPPLRLTHHSWNGALCAAWVRDEPPTDFIPIGKIPITPEEEALDESGEGAWSYVQFHPQEQWYWDHPEQRPAPEPSPEGRFILRRFNGDETYRFKKAVMFAVKTAKGVTLWFEVKADPAKAKRCKDTAKMKMAPSAEVGVELADLDAGQLVGRKFSIPGTKSDAEDSCMSLFYYCEHEPLRKNKITVVSRTGNRFRVQWTAVTKDVVYADGSKPLNKVEIEGEFVFKEAAKWTKTEPETDG